MTIPSRACFQATSCLNAPPPNAAAHHLPVPRIRDDNMYQYGERTEIDFAFPNERRSVQLYYRMKNTKQNTPPRTNFDVLVFSIMQRAETPSDVSMESNRQYIFRATILFFVYISSGVETIGCETRPGGHVLFRVVRYAII